MQPFDKEYVCDIAKQILNIDSPTGYTKRAIDFMDEEAKKLGYTTGRNQKGNLLIYVGGKDIRIECSPRYIRTYGSFHQRQRKTCHY